MIITVFHKSKHNLVFDRGNSSLAWFWKRAIENLQGIMKDKECFFFIVSMVAKSVLLNDSYILICYTSWQVGASSRLCQFRCCNTWQTFYHYTLVKLIFNYIIVTDTDMEGNIRIDNAQGRRRGQYHFHWSVPRPKGSLSILILHSISATIVFIASKTRIWHIQCKCLLHIRIKIIHLIVWTLSMRPSLFREIDWNGEIDRSKNRV